MIHAVIFDVDGTLVDTVDQHARAWKEAFEYFNRIVPLELIREQIGKGGDQLMPVFLNTDEMETIGPDLLEYRKEHWTRNYLPKIQAFPGVPELFQTIRSRGKKIILASSCHSDELQIYKRAAGIVGLTDGEVTADDVSISKPHPEIFGAAMKLADVSAAGEIVVVGDSPYDAEAAYQLGIRTIGLRTGGYSDTTLLAAGASQIFDGPAEMLVRFDETLIAS